MQQSNLTQRKRPQLAKFYSNTMGCHGQVKDLNGSSSEPSQHSGGNLTSKRTNVRKTNSSSAVLHLSGTINSTQSLHKKARSRRCPENVISSHTTSTFLHVIQPDIQLNPAIQPIVGGSNQELNSAQASHSTQSLNKKYRSRRCPQNASSSRTAETFEHGIETGDSNVETHDLPAQSAMHIGWKSHLPA
ncbi:hypothetical protein PIB30_049987 [Stylosanthes scabra]|uniref:Uncharacterized protein n=1 Tax=Stylosanthes scabra TaxID=79078 RepID=A0ABU6RI28_9FABA|nr:hypothetical protein [Stylosanthes scabra]